MFCLISIKLQAFYFYLGLECLPTVNLPTGCFCTSGPTPTPYIPLVDILEEIATKANTVVHERNETFLNCSTDSSGKINFSIRNYIKRYNQLRLYLTVHFIALL